MTALALGALSYRPVPILEAGPLSLSFHGLFAAVGFLIGGSLIVRTVRNRGFDPEIPISGLTWAVAASIIGARVFTIPAHLIDWRVRVSSGGLDGFMAQRWASL